MDKKLHGCLISAMVELHKRVASTYRAQPRSFHYQFSMRDIAHVMHGIIQAPSTMITTPIHLVRLWLHESHRIYRDRLIDQQDITTFDQIAVDVITRNFYAAQVYGISSHHMHVIAYVQRRI